MIRQIATESNRINDLAMNKAYDVVAKALKAQKGFK